MKLQELIAQYQHVRLATSADNQKILNFVSAISMQTGEGGIGIERGPNFFSLAEMQGYKSFVFLFLNSDSSIGGIACISLSKMQIEGKTEVLAYLSDLKLAKKIEKETRIEFYRFYELVIQNFSKIDELDGCQFVTCSILEDNTAAKKALVHKKTRKNTVEQWPLYTYENINVIGRIPFVSKNRTNVVRGSEMDSRKIKDFLVSNPDDSHIVWSPEEIERRQMAAGFSWNDFMVAIDLKGDIQACCIDLSDYQYRKLKVTAIPKSLKVAQLFTPLLGQPKIEESSPLRIGYLSFLKMKTQVPQEREKILVAFLNEIYRNQAKLPKEDRYHTINLQEPKAYEMGKKLLKKGFINNSFSSTVYQLSHDDLQPHPIGPTQGRMDFDVVFH